MHVEMINGMIKNGFNASGNPNITGSIIEKIAAGIERIANFFRNLTFEVTEISADVPVISTGTSLDSTWKTAGIPPSTGV